MQDRCHAANATTTAERCGVGADQSPLAPERRDVAAFPSRVHADLLTPARSSFIHDTDVMTSVSQSAGGILVTGYPRCATA